MDQALGLLEVHRHLPGLEVEDLDGARGTGSAFGRGQHLAVLAEDHRPDHAGDLPGAEPLGQFALDKIPEQNFLKAAHGKGLSLGAESDARKRQRRAAGYYEIGARLGRDGIGCRL